MGFLILSRRLTIVAFILYMENKEDKENITVERKGQSQP